MRGPDRLPVKAVQPGHFCRVRADALASQSPLSKSSAQSYVMAEVSYDLVVLGATGFTGQIAAAYLAKNYPGSSRLKVSAAVG